MVAQATGSQFKNKVLTPLATPPAIRKQSSLVRLELSCVHKVGLTFLIIVKQASLSARMLSQRICSWLSESREMALLDRSI